MYLSKRGSIYYVFYEKPDGKLSCKSTKTSLKSEALKFLANFKDKLPIRGSLPEISLKDFNYKFLAYSESIHTGKTYRDYKTTFKHFEEYLSNVKLSEISTKSVGEYIQYRIKSSSIHQGRKDLINLSSSFNKAVSDGYLLVNPCRGIKRIKSPEKQPLYYSHNDFDSLIKVIDKDDIKELVIFAVNTGLRQIELIQLQWPQIDFKRKYLILDNRNYITKGKKVRTIPLNETAFIILNSRLHKNSTGFVFTLGNTPINQDYLIHQFKKYVIAAKLNKKLNFHSLRHTFATWLIQKGASIYDVSKLLGHADIKTTEIYSHINPEDLRESVDLLSTKPKLPANINDAKSKA